jgi:hypothetical protein
VWSNVANNANCRLDRNNTMESRTIINLVAIFSLLFQACGGKDPALSDIIGRWQSSDGAMFVFNKDGTFREKSFLAEFVLLPKNEYKNVRFDGTGTWLFRKGSSNWEVYIDFKEVSNKKCSSAFPLLIAKENGILENKPPWYLFVWKEEEGGERYKFIKK